jgi:DNA-binding transcriptional LysR family regulator
MHVSQPPFSKQIRELQGELLIDLFDRHRIGVALTPAGKAFLIDARHILEDGDASIRKAQRISRGEIGELAIRTAATFPPVGWLVLINAEGVFFVQVMRTSVGVLYHEG